MGFQQDRTDYWNMLSGVKTFQIYHDKDKSLSAPKIFHCRGEMPDSWILKLEDLNSTGIGVHMTINETNGRGRKATDIVRIRACAADFDKTVIGPVWDYRPSMVVATSPGKYHAYWKVYDFPIEAFKQMQKGIIHKFNTDAAVNDLPRCLRIPGFYHSKGERFMVHIIHKSDDVYSFGEMQEMFPPAPVEQWSAEKYRKQYDGPQDEEFRGVYGASEPGRNLHISKRIGGMIKRNLPWGLIEQEAMREGEACNPPLPFEEVRDILKSMRRYV